jgi:Fungal N-terminal domain of STAND proteins
MEGIGVTASIITVITLGLQSSKFIFEAVSGIKGGPATVQKLVKAAQNLSKLLEQIKEIARRATETLGEHDAQFFEDLKPLLCDCVGELQHIRETLGKITRSSDSTLWKNVKTYLHEKDFDKMWNRIHYYVQFLGTQLVHAGM